MITPVVLYAVTCDGPGCISEMDGSHGQDYTDDLQELFSWRLEPSGWLLVVEPDGLLMFCAQCACDRDGHLPEQIGKAWYCSRCHITLPSPLVTAAR